MKEFELKYGCNPNQKPARIYMDDDSDLPIEILNGKPGYINFLDAFNSWQLVKELKDATGVSAATSFKHVSPTSAAIGNKMSEKLKKATFVDDVAGIDSSEIATAYARARGTDRMSSFGDFIALSDICDETCAAIIKREVSDGIIAPGYTEGALDILKSKKNGNYNIIKIDPDYMPNKIERKRVYGITFEQERNTSKIDKTLFRDIVTQNKEIPDDSLLDLIISEITLKYTQSNSVVFAYNGQAIGVGAGQQSRIHCTRLAAEKADKWLLRQSDKVLDLPFKEGISRAVRDNAIDLYLSGNQNDILAEGKWEELFKEKPEPYTKSEAREYLDNISGVSLGSDAFFPFGDNIERAAKSGVSYVAEPGGSVRDSDVIKTCDEHHIVMAFTGLRLFHH